LGVLFAFIAIIAIVYGLKHDDATSRGFGITFLFINLYTKYFEFFWNGMHKAIFFILLAASFLVDWPTCRKTLELRVSTQPITNKERSSS
jgi:uncharacterized membrane protein